MADSKRELAARVIKVGMTALNGEWKRTLSDAATEAVDTWAGANSKRPDALRRHIDHWASTHGTSQASVDLAFKIMTGALEDFGATHARIVELRRDPEKVAQEVLTAGADRLVAMDADGKIATNEDGTPRTLDSETRAACAQIAVTFYTHLLKDQETLDRLDSATVQEMYRRDIAKDEAERSRERHEAVQLQEDLVRYLSVLIDDLSIDVWPRLRGEHVLSVTDLERSLWVTEAGNAFTRERNADEVADSSQHLVILAGPGAGKTWLARRIARRAAIKALHALNQGAAIAEVEIPLLVTCDEFRTNPGQPRDAAITPALSHRSDLGAGTARRLSSTLQERESGILLVLDSLDEATTGIRDVDKALIGSWRTVITSRPAAWLKQWNTEAAGSRSVMETRLLELIYPDDVQAFIRAWFQSTGESTNPQAQALIGQLASNHAARAMSTTPLFLTFLCLVAPNGALPETRSGLLDLVVNRLLEWRAGDQNLDPALSRLLRVTQGWAWAAAENDPLSGLSAWPDQFVARTPPHEPTKLEMQQLDTIAPATRPTVPGTLGQVPRRFIHRAVREHLVAQYLATLPLDEATRHIAIHWFGDPTWREIIPTALANHPDCNAFLDRFVGRSLRMGGPRWRKILQSNNVQLLLGMCAESVPGTWSEANRKFLHEFRVQNAVENPALVARSSHWEESNSDVVEALAAHVSNAHRVNVTAVQALLELASTGPSRRTAAAALATYLPHARQHTTSVARAMVELDPDDQTLQVAIRALTKDLPHAVGRRGEVARLLMELDPSEHARHDVIQTLFNHLRDADGLRTEIAHVLVELDPGEHTRRKVVDVLTRRLAHARGQGRDITQALVVLATSEATSLAAVEALATYLPRADRLTGEVARAMAKLAITKSSRQTAAKSLSTHLNTAGDHTGDLACALVEVDPTEPTRHNAIKALTTYLPIAGYETGEIARSLLHVGASETTRQAVAESLIAYLPKAGHLTGDITRALIELNPNEITLRTAVESLTDHSSNAGRMTAGISRAIVKLDPSDTTRQAAVAALTSYLPDAGHTSQEVIRAIVELATTDTTREIAVTALANHLAHADPESQGALRALAELATTESTRQNAAAALTRYLPSANDPSGEIMILLYKMNRAETTRRAAAMARTEYLPYAGDRTPYIARTLRDLLPVDEWLAILAS